MDRRPLPLVALFLVSALAGCTLQESTDIVVTFYPLEFLTTEIVGDALTVSSVVKPGVEPHDYEPTPSDLRHINEARALVIQGAGFEAWLETAQKQAPATALIVATEGLDFLPNPEEHEHEEEGAEEHMEDEGGEQGDPHTWLDPVLYGATGLNIAHGLGNVWPEHAGAFNASADELAARLAGLDTEFQDGLAECETRFVITNHAAFGYMAARYNFTMISISGLDPNEEPDPKTIEHVIEEAREHDIRIIFFEEHVSPRVAETIAREVDVDMRVLSPIEFPPEAGGYVAAMRENLANLRDAMRCS